MATNDASPQIRGPRRTPLPSPAFFALLATALAAAAYVNTLHNPFVYDDHLEIVRNPSIRSLADLEAVLTRSPTRPLVNLTYAVDFAWSELRPFGYHLTNVVLHATNVLLLFVLTRRLARRLPPATGAMAEPALALSAFTAAGLFAVHPAMTEAVGYVSSRSELLCGSLFLGSLVAFTRVVDGTGGTRWAALGAALFALAAAARETAVMLPFVLLAYAALLPDRVGARRPLRWRVHATLVGVVLLLGAARLWVYTTVEHSDASGIQWHNLPLGLEVLARYVWLLVAPVSLTIVQPVFPVGSWFDLRVVVATASLAVMAATAISLRRRYPLATFGALWFVIVQAPAAALILVADRGQPMAEHRIYLASCGFFMVCAVVVGRLCGRADRGDLAEAVRDVAEAEASALRTGRQSYPRRFVATAAGLALALAILLSMTVARNEVWSDHVRLWEDAARKAPATYIAHYGLAEANTAIGDCASAIPAYERAVALLPHELAYHNLSLCLSDLGRAADARRSLREGIGHLPATSLLRLTLAGMEERNRNPAEALRLCREALALAPDNGEAAACVARNESAVSGG